MLENTETEKDNPGKVATYDTQGEVKQDKNTTQYVLGRHYAQTYTNSVNKTNQKHVPIRCFLIIAIPVRTPIFSFIDHVD